MLRKIDLVDILINNAAINYCKSIEDCHKKLADVKTKYTIQLGNDHNKMDKYGKELYNVSFVK